MFIAGSAAQHSEAYAMHTHFPFIHKQRDF